MHSPDELREIHEREQAEAARLRSALGTARPCVFCVSASLNVITTEWAVCVHCMACAAIGPQAALNGDGDALERAVELWNRRYEVTVRAI